MACAQFFGANGEVYFYSTEDQTRKFVYHVKEDESGLERRCWIRMAIFTALDRTGNSWRFTRAPQWNFTPRAVAPRPTTVCSICGTAGGENRAITPPSVSCSPEGKFLYLNIRVAAQIYAVPLQPGRSLPPLPASVIRSVAEAGAFAGSASDSGGASFCGSEPNGLRVPQGHKASQHLSDSRALRRFLRI
jgi:hypothetical protein